MKALLISKDIVKTLSFEKTEEQYRPLLIKKAKQWFLFEYWDIYQVGLLGLWKAYRNYDLKKGICFGHYASKIINREIYLYSRDTSQNGFEENVISLNDIQSRDAEEEVEKISCLEDDGFEEELLEKICLEDFLDTLPTDQKNVIVKYYYEDKNQTNIGKLMNISQVSVHKKIASGLNHLRKKYKISV